MGQSKVGSRRSEGKSKETAQTKASAAGGAPAAHKITARKIEGTDCEREGLI